MQRQIKDPPILNGPAATPVTEPVPKFWNIAEINEEEAEITMYGEVMSRRPVDWWTGKPIEGLFITPEGFLEDLAQIKDKAKITVRINSVGGEVYTAIGICNRLKELKGDVIAVIDGIAASAATIIAMGCKTREIGAGALFMIHEASTLLRGNYNHKALMEAEKRLEAANKAAAEIYETATHMGTKKIREIMAEEEWYTGKEAVEAGFCDAVRDELETNLCMGPEREEIIVNGIRHSISGFKHFPGFSGIDPIINSTAPEMPRAAIPSLDVDINKDNKSGGNSMTPEELKKQYPEAVAQIEAAARKTATDEAITAERTRLQEIEEIEATVGDKELITEAKYGDKACTAQELAFIAMKKQAQLGDQYLKDMTEDFTASGADAVTALPNAGNPQPEKMTQNENEQIAQLAAMIANGGTMPESKKEGEK